MKKIIKLTESDLRRIVANLLQEGDIYKDQWQDEIEMFKQGLKRGTAFSDENGVYVEIYKTEDNKDPRYVYYRKGSARLRDDHFCVQNSPNIPTNLIKDIYDYAGWDFSEDFYEDYGENCEYTYNPRLVSLHENNLSTRQIKNITGIEDDDEVNAAEMTEKLEDFERSVYRAIRNELTGGQRMFDTPIKTQDLYNLLEKFGFRFFKTDERNEAYVFRNQNNKYVLELYPTYFYPKGPGQRIMLSGIGMFESSELDESIKKSLRKIINKTLNSHK